MVPYFLWSAIGLFAALILSLFAKNPSDEFVWWSHEWWWSTFGVTSPPRYMYHLWFVRSVFVFVLVSPVIGLALNSIVPLFALFMVSLMCNNLPYWLSQGLFFCVLGGYIAINCPQIIANKSTQLTRDGLVALWFMLILLSIAIQVPINVMFLSNCIGVASMWALLDDAPIDFIDTIATSSFFIYCCHWPIYGYVGALIKRVPIFCNIAAVRWFVTPCLVIFCAMAVRFVLKRKFNYAYIILSGGR